MSKNIIKFRFWAKKAKKFIYLPRSWFQLDGTLNVDYEGDDLEIQQWTGLKDKNGKEIYEGDIIEEHHPEQSKAKEIVKWSDCIDGDGHISSGYCLNAYNYDSDPDFGVVVLGNIYENPELTKLLKE